MLSGKTFIIDKRDEASITFADYGPLMLDYDNDLINMLSITCLIYGRQIKIFSKFEDDTSPGMDSSRYRKQILLGNGNNSIIFDVEFTCEDLIFSNLLAIYYTKGDNSIYSRCSSVSCINFDNFAININTFNGRLWCVVMKRRLSNEANRRICANVDRFEYCHCTYFHVTQGFLFDARLEFRTIRTTSAEYAAMRHRRFKAAQDANGFNDFTNFRGYRRDSDFMRIEAKRRGELKCSPTQDYRYHRRFYYELGKYGVRGVIDRSAASLIYRYNDIPYWARDDYDAGRLYRRKKFVILMRRINVNELEEVENMGGIDPETEEHCPESYSRYLVHIGYNYHHDSDIRTAELDNYSTFSLYDYERLRHLVHLRAIEREQTERSFSYPSIILSPSEHDIERSRFHEYAASLRLSGIRYRRIRSSTPLFKVIVPTDIQMGGFRIDRICTRTSPPVIDLNKYEESKSTELLDQKSCDFFDLTEYGGINAYPPEGLVNPSTWSVNQRPQLELIRTNVNEFKLTSKLKRPSDSKE